MDLVDSAARQECKYEVARALKPRHMGALWASQLFPLLFIHRIVFQRYASSFLSLFHIYDFSTCFSTLFFAFHFGSLVQRQIIFRVGVAYILNRKLVKLSIRPLVDVHCEGLAVNPAQRIVSDLR
jgi:hypothetical protein